MHVIVIGAGFAGLSAAAHLAHRGVRVTVVDRHEQAGGRARTWSQDGFTFDMGPSWYWMPDLFERFFAHFDRRVGDLYDLQRLDPSYRIVWPGGEAWDLPAERSAQRALFERVEPGAGVQLDRFLSAAGDIYRLAVDDYLLRPSVSLTEYLDLGLLRALPRLRMLSTMERMAARYFDDARLRQIVSWPVLFLGAKASDTPAMYSLMSYADLQLGTWYPRGGMHRIIEAMVDVATTQGADLVLGTRVERIRVDGGRVVGIDTDAGFMAADAVVGTGDYHHIEQELLPVEARSLTPSQWDRKVMAPSSLLFYVGLRGDLDLPHHTLFFDADMDTHLDAVYADPAWPDEPLFYACVPSATDPDTAPEGHSNLFVLVPLAPGLADTEADRERVWTRVMDRLEAHVGHAVADRVVLRRDFGVRDFVDTYSAYKGNAYGMANTLLQTGPFRPPLRSPKVRGMYFAGQLTVPGPGMPPSLVSGELAARLLLDDRGSGR